MFGAGAMTNSIPEIRDTELMFVIGSLLFFKAETTYVGTWLFLIGSVLFSLRPGVKLFREIALIRMGRYKDMGKDI